MILDKQFIVSTNNYMETKRVKQFIFDQTIPYNNYASQEMI